MSEFWRVLSGRREIRRGDESREELTVLEPGVSIDIPVGTEFQYRWGTAAVSVHLDAALARDAETTHIEGQWVPTAQVEPDGSAIKI